MSCPRGVDWSKYLCVWAVEKRSWNFAGKFAHELFEIKKPKERREMSDHVYKTTEVVGSSKKSIEDAVHNAVNRTAKTVRNMRWMEVQEIRGHIDEQELAHWQVSVKIGFTVDD